MAVFREGITFYPKSAKICHCVLFCFLNYMVKVLDVNWSFRSLPTWYRSPLESHQTCALLTFCFYLHWVFVAASGLSLVVDSRGYSICGAWASYCSGFSCFGAWSLDTWASVVALSLQRTGQ